MSQCLDVLEFAKVQRLLSAYAVTVLGKQRAVSLEPEDDLYAIDQALALTTEMKAALQAGLVLPLSEVYDVRPPVERAGAGGGPLTSEDLWQIGRTVQACCAIGRQLGMLQGESGGLRRLAARIPRLSDLADELLRGVDAAGIVRDQASPELDAIRRQLAAIRKRLHDHLQGLLNSPGVRPHLQYPNYTIVRDRYALPLSAGSRHIVPGIVHGTSDSGATLYVEPHSIVALGNQLCQLQSEEDAEEKRIRWRLTHAVGERHRDVLGALDLVATIDLTFAKARLSIDYHMTEPKVTDELVLELQAARHPLLIYLQSQKKRGQLDEQSQAPPAAPDVGLVVPMDVHLGDDFHVIVVTGPNTGGKTVTLKTIGLLCLMARAGMHVSAERARIPFYDAIYADIGDEQSLEQNLSTFSAHISHIVGFLREAGPRSLVLLDELGAGTDPIEGAALGRVIIEALAGRRTSAVLTTHLGELKSLGFTQPGVENASVEFDAATLRPTFRLSIGTPGASNALQIARHFGFPEPLLERADHYSREMRGDSRERLLSAIQEAREEAEQRRQRAQLFENEARDLKARYETLLQKIRDEEARKDLGWAVEVKKKTASLAETARQLHDEFRFSHKKQARTLKTLADELTALNEKLSGSIVEHSPGREMKPGDEIYVPRLHRWGHVVRLDRKHGTVVVSYGQGTAELPLPDVLLWEDVAKTERKA